MVGDSFLECISIKELLVIALLQALDSALNKTGQVLALMNLIF